MRMQCTLAHAVCGERDGYMEIRTACFPMQFWHFFKIGSMSTRGFCGVLKHVHAWQLSTRRHVPDTVHATNTDRLLANAIILL